MLASSKASVLQREQLVSLFEAGFGPHAASRRVGVGVKTSKNLWERWCIHGRLVLMHKPTPSQYSFEVKLQVVERFLSGQTKMSIAKELGLSSPKLLEKWVRIYRTKGVDGLRPRPKGRPRKDPHGQTPPVSELDQLKRRLEYLEAENAYLKALRDLMNNEH
ncbi:helix-turn-helix domain-containing protein [Arcanobacterium phocae]|uniref:helix-turn-helix domain-containing protein n=1 Tax=Arcanobacterium phocae TaxID=131112 RepID=UPI001C0F12F0|nr:helix-turn-helix domain-containing protein [Arcanobacterium phocae]